MNAMGDVVGAEDAGDDSDAGAFGRTPIGKWLLSMAVSCRKTAGLRVAAAMCPFDPDHDMNAVVPVDLAYVAQRINVTEAYARSGFDFLLRMGAIERCGDGVKFIQGSWPSRREARESESESITPATHAELVRRAARWLAGTQRCGLVMSEFTTRLSEIPDVIGWCDSGRNSVLVECKASRSDFQADHKKPHRNPLHAALGRRRWFFAPPGIIRPDELPEGWGLAECGARRVSVIVEPSERFAASMDVLTTELQLMYSVARRALEDLGAEAVVRKALLAEEE